MTRFRLPSSLAHQDALRRQIRAWGNFYLAIQLLVGGILPIFESVLTGFITSEAEDKLFFVELLCALGLIHTLLLSILVWLAQPLPQFLDEFDQQANELDNIRGEAKTYETIAQTYAESHIAISAALRAIEQMLKHPVSERETAIENVLRPWIEAREDIFWYFERHDLDNFAVYLFEEEVLKKAFRHCHRNISVTNREWKSGDGHVGLCYATNRTIVSTDINDPAAKSFLENASISDQRFYQAFISTPIRTTDGIVGVLVITSSRAGQFDEGVHKDLAETAAFLVGQSLRYCWSGYKQWIKSK